MLSSKNIRYQISQPNCRPRYDRTKNNVHEQFWQKILELPEVHDEVSYAD